MLGAVDPADEICDASHEASEKIGEDAAGVTPVTPAAPILAPLDELPQTSAEVIGAVNRPLIGDAR